MNKSTIERFERLAAWQRQRAKLSWSEKLRQSLILREAYLRLQASRTSDAESQSPKA
jgi:hypothetical protein